MEYRDPDEDVMKRVKVDTPSFDGRRDPKVFLDWISDMNFYFEWYHMSENIKVGFEKMKLTGQAKLY